MVKSKLFSGSCHSRAFGSEYGFRRKWNLLQNLYIRIFGLVDLPSRLRARLIMPVVEAGHPSEVIDLGCGTGSYSLCLSRRSECLVHSLEIDKKRLEDLQEIASQLGRSNIFTMNGSAEDTLGRIGECSIDAVVAIESLAYIPNLDAAMKEIARVLKPGGLLVGHVPSMGYLRPSECHLFNEGSLHQRLEKAGLMAQEISRTMGGSMAAFCRVFEWLSRSYFILSVFFPLLLIGTLPFRVRHPNGKYIFITARKNTPVAG